MFDVKNFCEFRFNGFTVDNSVAVFEYSAVGVGEFEDLVFREVVDFSYPIVLSENLVKVLNLLGAALGVSYYKMFIPLVYNIVPLLSLNSAAYLDSLITYGLAEFAYRNNLPSLIRNVLNINTVENAETVANVAPGVPLVAIGGGKDSIVTVELLKNSDIDFACFTVNASTPHLKTIPIVGKPHLNVERKYDSKLFTLVDEGALTGHVPITAYNSLIGVALAHITGNGLLILSNELSADVETLVWNGEKINHQWAKSSEAEKLLNLAIEGETGFTNNVLSVLKPYMEITIAEIYADKCGMYDEVVVSCNKAYKVGQQTGVWCGDCDKCRFVGLIFAPYMSKERLYSITGFELFAVDDDLGNYVNLVNTSGKPFECVGDVSEAVKAFKLLKTHPEWANNNIVVQMCNIVETLTNNDSSLKPQPLPLSPYKEAADVFFKK